MRKPCLILLFFTIWLFNGATMKNFAAGNEKLPLDQVLHDMQEQSNYKFYYHQQDIKGITAPVLKNNEDPVAYLREVFIGTSLKVSFYKHMIFITRDTELITTLITSYQQNDSLQEYADLYLFRPEQIKAVSENILYEVGNKNRPGTALVELSGIITDFRTNEPVEGVNIVVKNTNTGTVTNKEGYYSLTMPPGKSELIIQGVDIKNTVRQLQVYSSGTLDIELEEEIHTLSEITVSSERLANVRSTIMGVEHLKIKEMKNIPAVFGETDIIRVMLSLPGVKSAGELSSGFNVRGGSTDQNLILFNEGTIYNPSHLFGMFSVFNPDIVNDMEFYKSTIPAKYGGRISSVLEIRGKEADKEKFSGSASIGLLTSRLTLEVPLIKQKTSLIVGGRTTYSDWLLGLLPEKSGYKDGKAGFYDFNATLSHTVNERNNLYLSGYYSHDRFNFDANEKYTYRNANASFKWRNVINPALIGSYVVGYDHYDYITTDKSHTPTAYELTFGIKQLFGKADFKWIANEKHSFSFGLNSLLYILQPGRNIPADANSLVKENVLQKEKALESALYASWLWDITSALSFDAGVRFSVFNVLGKRDYNLYEPEYLPSPTTILETKTGASGILKTYANPEFRLSMRYAFTNNFSVKAGFNTTNQYIHKISNTTVISPTDTWKLSDVNIKPQDGMQVSLGLYKNFMNGVIETSLEGYYKKIGNYLDYRPGAVLVMNPHIETDVIQTDGRAYGVELMIKKPSGKLNGWISYAYSRTELRQSDIRMESPVNNGNWYAADFDKPHEIKLIGNYRFTHRYSLSVNCEYSTGRPITLPVSKFNYKGEEYVYYSDRNQYRIPDYFRTDISFNIEPGHHLTGLTHSTLSFGVYNVTGRKNVYSIYYVSEEGFLKGYQMSIFGVPIPYISYNIKF